MGSIGAATVDIYFKNDWEPGTGPNSASFKDALSWAKRRIDNETYNFEDTVESAAVEYYLNTDESSLLSDKLKMYAITHDNYTNNHAKWLEEFNKRGIKVTGRRTKIEKEMA